MSVFTVHFSEKELQCKCGCARNGMNQSFMEMVETLRVEVDHSLPVSSAYRCDKHDKAVHGAGVHPSGYAIDLKCYSRIAWKVLRAAARLGFTGIGISQKGPYGSRFIHLDSIKSTTHPRPTTWTY